MLLVARYAGPSRESLYRALSNRTQAVRLPLDVRLPEGVQKVGIRVKGRERIIGPVDQTWDSYFLDGLAVSDDFLPERATPHQAEREALWQCPP